MRVEFSDSRIGLELLVKMVLLESFQICIQFIDTTLCCKIRIFQIYRYIFLLVVPLNLSFPRYKLYKFDTSCSFRFFLPLTVSGRQRIKSETTTGRTRGPSCTNIHLFRTFSHFLSVPSESKRRCVTIHETILSPMKHRSTVSIKHGNHSREDHAEANV